MGGRNGDAGVMTWRWDPARRWDGDGSIWQARWDRWDKWKKRRNGEGKMGNWRLGALRPTSRGNLGNWKLIWAGERRKGRRLRDRNYISCCSRHSVSRVLIFICCIMLLGERKRILMTCLQHNLTYNKMIKCCVKPRTSTLRRLEKQGANL